MQRAIHSGFFGLVYDTTPCGNVIRRIQISVHNTTTIFTTKEILEREKLIQENLLLKARTDQIRDAKGAEELYKNALDAMKSYSGNSSNKDDDEEDDR